MPRNATRPLLSTLTLIALVLLAPTLATALPPGAVIRSVAERAESAPSFFDELWSFLSAVWAQVSGPDPNVVGSGQRSEPGTGPEPNAAAGDNGSGLEPDGRP